MNQPNITFPKIRTLFVILFLILLVASANCQKPVVLHPIIGDTIDLVEKLDYLLFAEIPDSLFDKGTLIKEGENYQLKVWYNSEISRFALTSNEFEQYAQNVAKLSVYYKQTKESSSGVPVESPLITNDSIPLKLDIEWMSEQQKQKMASESRRYNNLKLEADEQGLMGFDREKYIKTGGEMEFPLSH